MATKAKEYNKSLSARIKRRNKQGFKGEGSRTSFNLYCIGRCGDYRDVEQSHRDSKDRTRNLSILCEAMKVGVIRNHPGSKPIGKIVKMLKSLHKSTALHKAYLESKFG